MKLNIYCFLAPFEPISLIYVQLEPRNLITKIGYSILPNRASSADNSDAEQQWCHPSSRSTVEYISLSDHRN